MAPRGWGYWTEAKLDILSSYLPAFTTASKSAESTVYLDLFAGNEANQRRDTGDDVDGSPVRALATTPEFTALYFCELEPIARQLEPRLREQFPGRRFKVIPGDCNETIEGVLESIRRDNLRRAPIFAFIDPYNTSELRWTTLAMLAAFKADRPYKVELWILFFGSAIPRVMGLNDPVQDETISRLFGSEEWRPIAEARRADALSIADARAEYTNLMRWRIESQLGYRWTHTLEVKDTHNRYLYDLIFATDNAAGNTIMRDVYSKAIGRNEQMRLEALEIRRERQSGQPSLFGADVASSLSPGSEAVYVHEPPRPPFGSEGLATDGETR